MYKKSIWEINMKNKKCDKLEKNIITDVLIIGGGITGISTAFYLMNSDKKIMLVEQNQIGSGVTSKTTGKLTYLQELVYSKLEKTFNYEYSKLYLESQLEAIYLVKSNIKKYKIQCDFSEVPSYTFTNKEYEIPKFKNEETFLKKSLINYEICNSIPINYPCKYAIKVNDTAVFHPIKYLFKLKEICIKNKVKIYENTKVTSIKKVDNNYICTCNGYNVIAKTVVLCCHYPFFLLPGFFPIKTKIEESYLMATPINSYNDFSAITNTHPTKSFRYHKDNKKTYIIFVAQSHNLAFNLNRQERYKALKNEFRKTLKLNGKYYWTNQDIITDDSLPIIGNLSNKYPNLLIGTGYNTWGMTNGTIAGKILSDIINNKDNKYIDLFNPNRHMNLEKFKNRTINIFSNVKAYIDTKLTPNKSWYKDSVKFEIRNGKKVGIYIDQKGIEHIVYNICPHLRCSLIFNMQDKTWDCPCHSSRFNIDGKNIKGPSLHDITFNENE